MIELGNHHLLISNEIMAPETNMGYVYTIKWKIHEELGDVNLNNDENEAACNFCVVQ